MNQLERIYKAEKVVKAAIELKALYLDFPKEPINQANRLQVIVEKQKDLWDLLEPFEAEMKKEVKSESTKREEC